VVGVTFQLRVGGKPTLRYEELTRCFRERGELPTLAEVREAVLRIRASKSMLLVPGDPDCRSAGSFFKNPVVEANTLRRIEETARRLGLLAPDEAAPCFSAPGGLTKVPAAWLIESSGFRKGEARGRVGISTKHALALINRGGASARELLDLAREIQARVLETFGVELVPEPVFLGF
jgi:UDP-N-acetylmuramate dehydrogenase